MILNKLTASLSPIVNGMLAVLAFVQQKQLVLALLAGLTMPFFASMKSDERQKAPLWKRLIIAFSLLCFLSGTLAPIVIGSFQWLYKTRLTSDNTGTGLVSTDCFHCNRNYFSYYASPGIHAGTGQNKETSC